MLRGLGVSGGIGIGRVLRIESAARTNPTTQPGAYDKGDVAVGADAYLKEFSVARESFVTGTEELVSKLKTRLGDKALVLKNQIYLVNDIEFIEAVNRNIAEAGMDTIEALMTVCDMYSELFRSMDGVMAERAADFKDIKESLTIKVLELRSGKADTREYRSIPKGTVIVTEELLPSMTAKLDIDNIAGIIASKGGETSHAAILARALNVPAVLGVADIMSAVGDDDRVILDGETGEVILDPSEELCGIYKERQEAYRQRSAELSVYADRQTMTSDGHRVRLVANIGDVGECAKAMSNGAEGIGLFRTEFLFMNRDSLPTEEEQLEAYRAAAVQCRVLTIRTLDIGGDKDVPYMCLKREANPFLGYRAIRYCLGREDVFATQLRAILRASAYGSVKLMLPMVTTLEELRSAKSMLRNLMKELDEEGLAYDKDIKIGVMIETPAAAVMADAFADEVDFFSIGTNDLTQYTMAVDRGNESVAYLYSVYEPSVLRLIKHVIECGVAGGIEVCMCGEAAADRRMLPLLLAWGLEEFSVSPAKVLETRRNIACISMPVAKRIAESVMRLHTRGEIVDALSSAGEELDIE